MHSIDSIKKIQISITLFYALFIIFTLFQFIVPYLHDEDSVNNVRQFFDFNADQINNLGENNFNFYPDLIYYVGHYTCHQIYDRSFELNRNQLPICSRCLGIYIGMSMIFFLGIIKQPRGSFFHSLSMLMRLNDRTKTLFYNMKIIIFVGLLFATPMLLDVFIQIFTDYMSTNQTRLMTGILFGIFEGGLVIGILSHFNFIIARMYYTRPNH